jgi:hypothetical protein
MLQKEYTHHSSPKIQSSSYAPTRDVIAIATEDNKLTVHRLANEKLTKLFAADSSTLQSPITALTWRPDGETLALGHRDGSFSVYHIENKTKIQLPKAAKPHSDRITCLHWEECEEKGDEGTGPLPSSLRNAMSDDENDVYDAWTAAAYFDDDGALSKLGPSKEGRKTRLSRVPKKPRAFATDDGLTTTAAEDKEREETEFALTHGCDQPFTILASGDSTGVVTLSAYGYFPVGCVDLSGAFVKEKGFIIDRPTVCNIRMTPDISTLTVTLRARLHKYDGSGGDGFSTSSPSSSSSSSNSTTSTDDNPLFRYHVCHVDTSLLYDRRNEISEIALHFGAIGELIEHMKTTFTMMEQAWVDGTRTLDGKWENLRTILRSHDRHPSPRAELLTTFLSGITSDALAQFFSSHLSPQKVIRMHKGLDGACTNIDNLYVNHFHVAMEGLLYRLSELRGLARWRKYFLSIGLLHHSLQELVQSASTLLLKGEEFVRDERSSRVNFRSLCTWLHGCSSKASSMDVVPHQRRSTKMYDTEILLELLQEGEDDGILSQGHVLNHFRLSTPSRQTSNNSRNVSNINTTGDALGVLALASMKGTNHATLSSMTLARELQTLVTKVQTVLRQPYDKISQSFRPKVNIPVFSFVGTQEQFEEEEEKKETTVMDEVGGRMSVPNCMLAIHVRTDDLVKKQRLIAFSGREADIGGEPGVNSVWLMKRSVGGIDECSNEENTDKEETDENEPTRRKRERDTDDEDDDTEKTTTNGSGGNGARVDSHWSIGCVPLPIGYSVVAMDYYGGGETEEWLVLLMSTLEGDSVVALLNDQHENIQYQNIGIELSHQLPPTTTLVQLAEREGLIKDPSLYEQVLVTSECIPNSKPSSMDVCASRGYVTVCTDDHTLHLYAPDIDDDDEEEDEEEEEEEEEDA